MPGGGHIIGSLRLPAHHGRWQTVEDFQAATQSPGFRESAAGLAGYQPHPGLYRVVRT